MEASTPRWSHPVAVLLILLMVPPLIVSFFITWDHWTGVLSIDEDSGDASFDWKMSKVKFRIGDQYSSNVDYDDKFQGMDREAFPHLQKMFDVTRRLLFGAALLTGAGFTLFTIALLGRPFTRPQAWVARGLVAGGAVLAIATCLQVATAYPDAIKKDWETVEDFFPDKEGNLPTKSFWGSRTWTDEESEATLRIQWGPSVAWYLIAATPLPAAAAFFLPWSTRRPLVVPTKEAVPTASVAPAIAPRPLFSQAAGVTPPPLGASPAASSAVPSSPVFGPASIGPAVGGTTRTKCPQCATPISVLRSTPIGSRVICPNCGRSVTVAA